MGSIWVMLVVELIVHIISVTNTLVTIQESINVESTNPKSCTSVWTQLGGDTSYEQKERKRRMFKNHFLFFRPFFQL